MVSSKSQASDGLSSSYPRTSRPYAFRPPRVVCHLCGDQKAIPVSNCRLPVGRGDDATVQVVNLYLIDAVGNEHCKDLELRGGVPDQHSQASQRTRDLARRSQALLRLRDYALRRSSLSTLNPSTRLPSQAGKRGAVQNVRKL